VGGGRLQTDAAQVVDGRTEADRAGDVGRAGLELVGQLGIGGLFEADGMDHVAATLIGRHGFQERAFAVQHADARGAVKLVPRKRIEVGIKRLHVSRPMCNPLGAVDQHLGAGLVGHGDDLLDGVDRA